MHICQVLCGSGQGGLERHVMELSNGLAERGHRVTLVAHAAYARLIPPRVTHIPLDLTGWRSNPVLLARLLRIIRHRRPDIVHAQANKAAHMVSTIARFISARHVATIHNIKKHTAVFNRFDGVIAVSRTAASHVRRARVEVIYNGIEPAEPPSAMRDYTAHTAGLQLQRPLVLTLGRLVPAKGFGPLINAWDGIDATLVIAGEGPERPALERLIAEQGLQRRVLLLGHRQDVPSLLADADLCVISSLREGYSYVMAEALHARKVIVSTRVAGPDEFLPEAYLVDPENVTALTDLIRKVISDMPGARRDYEPVWEYARRELTLARMVEHTEQFYRQVLQQ